MADLATDRWGLDLSGIDPALAAAITTRLAELDAARVAAEHAQHQLQIQAVLLETLNDELREALELLAERSAALGGGSTRGRVTRLEAERRRVEEAEREALVRQSQKLETVGLLAGGIAHDFNNVLTIILGNAAIARETLPAGAPARDELDEILDAARRGAALTRQLLALARQQGIAPALLDLHQVARDATRLLGRLVGSEVRLVLEGDAAPAIVYADAGQLAQVLMNLVVNARDAMPDGGTITVATRGDVPLPACAPPPEACALPGAGHVRFDHAHGALLVVRDTGTGMSAAVAARAFEPFFTTKAASHGTGLGLATVHGIVREAGGAAWIESAEGAGTTVAVWLPGAG